MVGVEDAEGLRQSGQLTEFRMRVRGPAAWAAAPCHAHVLRSRINVLHAWDGNVTEYVVERAGSRTSVLEPCGVEYGREQHPGAYGALLQDLTHQEQSV
ncbi:hypothetical protein [Streptomyces sp. NPDC059378]|uniref:hypothetical protein n=1 Tax=Streptomyces sp. NPDC059378 TaxID=3346815 RepID=UPI0036BF5C01